jgi:hypothetical protein
MILAARRFNLQPQEYRFVKGAKSVWIYLFNTTEHRHNMTLTLATIAMALLAVICLFILGGISQLVLFFLALMDQSLPERLFTNVGVDSTLHLGLVVFVAIVLASLLFFVIVLIPIAVIGTLYDSGWLTPVFVPFHWLWAARGSIAPILIGIATAHFTDLFSEDL